MDQTDSFQWIVQPSGTFALSSNELDVWLTYISVRLVQPLNGEHPIFVTLSGIVIEAREEQAENAYPPMLVTPPGIVIEVRE